MADSRSDFDFAFKNNHITGELDENGDIASFEAGGNTFKTKYKRRLSKKEIDRFKYNITGIPQLAMVAPNPPDREDLVDKKFSAKMITQKAWFSILVTGAAIIFDLFCYIMMFEGMVTVEDSVSDAFYLAAVAVAFVIDVIPAFFARILHTIVKNQRNVLKVFFALSFIFIAIFIFVCFAVRCKYYSTNFGDKNITDEIVIQSLIPIATTLVCFIVNYLSYDPYEKKLKTLHKLKLFREENINELEAMLVEIDSETDYRNRLLKQNEKLFDETYKMIDKIAENKREFIREAMALALTSPADTSDLSF